MLKNCDNQFKLFMLLSEQARGRPTWSVREPGAAPELESFTMFEKCLDFLLSVRYLAMFNLFRKTFVGTSN